MRLGSTRGGKSPEIMSVLVVDKATPYMLRRKWKTKRNGP